MVATHCGHDFQSKLVDAGIAAGAIRLEKVPVHIRSIHDPSKYDNRPVNNNRIREAIFSVAQLHADLPFDHDGYKMQCALASEWGKLFTS